MPHNWNKRIFHVVASRAGTGYSFALEEVDQKTGHCVPVSRLDFDKRRENLYKHGHHKVEIHLIPPEGSELKFHEDPSEVFWIGPQVPGTNCCADYADLGSEVELRDREDRCLKIRNRNSTAQELRFNLGFQDGSDPTRIAFDPGWGNSNSGFDLQFRSLAAGGALLLAGAGALIALAAKAVGKDRGRAKRR